MRLWERAVICGALVAFVVLAVVLGHCQNFVLPDAPSSLSDRNPVELKYSMKRSQWKFWALTGATAAVTAMDGWQTARPGQETGTPWLYSGNPDAHKVRLSLVLAGEVIGSALLARRFQHTRFHRFWMAPQAWILGSHVEGVIHNFRVGQY